MSGVMEKVKSSLYCLSELFPAHKRSFHRFVIVGEILKWLCSEKYISAGANDTDAEQQQLWMGKSGKSKKLLLVYFLIRYPSTTKYISRNHLSSGRIMKSSSRQTDRVQINTHRRRTGIDGISLNNWILLLKLRHILTHATMTEWDTLPSPPSSLSAFNSVTPCSVACIPIQHFYSPALKSTSSFHYKYFVPIFTTWLCHLLSRGYGGQK